MNQFKFLVTNLTRIGSLALKIKSDMNTTSSGFVMGFNSKFLIISPIAVRSSIIANFWPKQTK